MLRVVLFFATVIVAAFAAPAADRVDPLPGWLPTLPSKHYSGFLDVKTDTRVHYWLVESESSPATDPLIIWFNGGPPCSALVGSFGEMGPFMVTYGKETQPNALEINPGRWNQRANLLFYENPPGVGFSYNKDEKGYNADDNTQASDNLGALLAFYKSFPEYSGRQLFIAGESYAGVYIPMLAQQIVKHNAAQTEEALRVPLEGIMVGNGAIATGAWYEGYLTGLRMEHLYAHGLFSSPEHDDIGKKCTNYTKGVVSSSCQAALKKMANQTGVLNQYNIRETCLHGQNPNFITGDIADADGKVNPQKPLISSQDQEHEQERQSQQPQAKGHPTPSPPAPPAEDPCDLGSSQLIKYLNRADVQSAIHVSEAVPASSGNFSFSDCGPSFGRPVQYTRIPQDERVDVYPELIGQMRILIFNGDQDNCIPYTQDQSWTAGMGLEELEEGGAWHPWKVDAQVAGYATHYEKGFTFTTVKGAGHLCPLTQPQRTFEMMDRFVHGKQL